MPKGYEEWVDYSDEQAQQRYQSTHDSGGNYTGYSQQQPQEDLPNQERGYWEDPGTLYRWVNSARTSTTPQPDWLDSKTLDTAYRYMEMKNNGKPWNEWQPLAYDDPVAQTLRKLKVPPPDALTTYERDKWGQSSEAIWNMTQQPATPEPDYGQKKVAWNQMPVWQQIMTSIMSPQPTSGIEGRPEWSRLTAAGAQGAGAALGGIALGGAVGNVPGAVVGGLVAGLGTAYQSYTGNQIPVLNDVLNVFNIPAEGLEKIVGLEEQARKDGLDKILADLPAAWEAGRSTYESQQLFDVNNLVATMAGDQAAKPGEVWRYTEGYVEPIKAQGAIGADALGEARWRIKSGEDPDTVYADLVKRFGDTGIANDFIAQTVLDPMNLAGNIGGKVGEVGAKVAGKPELAAAFKNTRGNLIIDSLPFGVQQIAEAVTGKKASGGILDALGLYKEEVRSKALKSGQLDWFDRAIGGIDKEGRIKDFIPLDPKANFIQKWRSLTPEAQTGMFLSNMMDHLIRISYDIDSDPNLPDGQRAALMMQQLYKVAGTSPIKVGDVGEQILRSPMTATVQAALKEAMGGQKLKDLVTTYTSAPVQNAITQLKNLSQMLDTEPGLLLDTIANTPDAILKTILTKAAEQPDNQFYTTMAAEIQSGNLTPARLQDQFCTFTGKTSDGKTNPKLPWDFRDFRAQVMNLITDDAKDWSTKQFGVKEAGLVNRFASVLKAGQSAMLLDLSPNYLINNALNNWVTRASQGVFGFMTKKQISDWYERFGGTPVRMNEGFTPTGDIDTLQGSYSLAMDDVRKMVQGDGNLSKMLKEINKARQKFGVASKLSGKLEASESAQAYAIGTSRMWDRIWRPGNGFRKMPAELEAQLQAINPDLPGIIYSGIAHSMNPAEMEAALFKQSVNVNVSKIVDDVAEKLYPNQPDIAREMLRMTGIEGELKKELSNATTREQIDNAMHRVRDRIQDKVDRAHERKIALAADEAKAKIQSEGFKAVTDMMSEMERDVWSRWLEHYRDMSAFNEYVDTIDPALKNAEWRRMNARESKAWNDLFQHKVALYGVMLQELGIDTPEARKMLGLMEQRLQSLRDFFDGYDVDGEGNRVTPEFKLNNPDLVTHVDGKNDLYAKAFGPDSTMSFAEVEEMVNNNYAQLAEANRATQAEADQLFASLWTDKTDQQLAMQFRKRIAAIQEQMDIAVTEFRKTLGGKSRADRTAAWNDFLDNTYLKLIDQLQTEEVMGMYGKGDSTKPEIGAVPEDVVPKTAPAEQDIPTVADKVHYAEKVEAAINSQDAAKMRYEARLDRDIYMDKMQKSFKLSDEEMRLVNVMMDLYTEQWGKQYGREPNQWYSDRVADIDRGGKVNLNQLYQANNIDTPEFRNWFGDSKVVDENGQPLVVYHGTPSHGKFHNNKYIAAEMGETAFKPFTEFKIPEYGQTDSGWLGRGAYFTPDADFAEEFGNIIMPTYVSLKNPFRIFDDGTNSAKNNYRFLMSLQELPGLPESVRLNTELPKANEYIDYRGEKAYARYDVVKGTDSDGNESYFAVEYTKYKNGDKWDEYISREESGDTPEMATAILNDKLLGEDRREFLLSTITKRIGSSEFTELLKNAGYDGVMSFDQDGKKLYEVVAYDPHQIKSTFNRGTFDPLDPNILHQGDTIYDIANRYGIATATKGGRPNDKHLVAIVNKYGTEKISSAKDLTPDNLTAALEARRIEKGEPPVSVMSHRHKGATQFLEDGRAVIHAFEGADISTVIHESAHIFRRDLSEIDQNTILNWAGQKEWNVQAEEMFARGFERWLAGDVDIIPPEIHGIFQRLKTWLVKIYNGITGSSIDVNITPDVRGVFERMLFDEGMLEKSQPKPVEPPKPAAPEWITSAKAVDVEPLPKVTPEAQAAVQMMKQTAAQEMVKPVEPEWMAGNVETAPVDANAPRESINDYEFSKIDNKTYSFKNPKSGNIYEITKARVQRSEQNSTSYYISFGTPGKKMEYLATYRTIDEAKKAVQSFIENNNDINGIHPNNKPFVVFDTAPIDPELTKPTTPEVKADVQRLQAEAKGITDQPASIADIEGVKVEERPPLSEYVTNSLEKAIRYNEKIGAKSPVWDKKPGEYVYISYARPIDDMWATIPVEHRYVDSKYIFTKEPLDSDTIVRYELGTWGESKVKVVKDYYQNRYGVDPENIIVLQNTSSDRQLFGVVITKSVKEEGAWQATRFDERGWIGDTTYKSIDKAIGEALQDGYREPMDPNDFDSWASSDKFLQGVENTIKVQMEMSRPKVENPPIRPDTRVRKSVPASGYTKGEIDLIAKSIEEWVKRQDFTKDIETRKKISEVYRNKKYSSTESSQLISELKTQYEQHEPLVINVPNGNKLTFTGLGAVDAYRYLTGKRLEGFEDFVYKPTENGRTLFQSPEWTPEKLAEFFDGMVSMNDKGALRYALSDEPLATRMWLADQMYNYSPEARALVEPVAKAMYMYGELQGNVFDSRTKKLLTQTAEPTPNGTGQAAAPVFDEHALLDEILHDRLNPLLDEIGNRAAESLNTKKLGVNGVPPEVEAAVRKYMKQVTAMDMPGAKMTASRYGEMQRDMSLLNYQKQYGFDTTLNLVFPYQFWYTRSMMNWAKRAINKPAWFSFYARMREMQRKNEQKGIPERMRGKIRIPAPFMPDWTGGAIWYDPYKQLFPFSQFGNPLDQMNQTTSRQQYIAQDVLRQMVKDGKITTEQMNEAMEKKSGMAWELAWSQAGESNDNDLSNPAGIVGMMMQPAMYLTAPYYALTGQKEKIGTLPMTRLAGGVETLSKNTPLEGIGKLIGTLGAGGERFIRQKNNLSEFGEFGDYYVDRALSSMVVDGEIDSTTAVQAMIEKSGEAYQKAYERAAYEQAIRTPGLMPLAAIKGMNAENAGASIATGLAAAMFPAGIISKGEMELRGLSEEYSNAWKKYNAGDKQAVNAFFDEHPEYEARLAQYKEPQERLRNFLSGQIWDAYNDMTGPNKKIIREALGEPFIDTFLDKTVSDTTAIDLDTLAYWARFLGAKVPKTEETKSALNQPLYQQQPVEMMGSQTNNAVQAYWDEKSKKFPNIDAINDLYYSNGRSKAVLNKFPELREYWDWKKQYEKSHPDVAKYLDYQSQQNESTSFGGARSAVEKMPKVTLDDMKAMDPALQRQLYGYIYSGEPLTRGARTELYRVWQAAGRPGGTLDEYIDSIKRAVK